METTNPNLTAWWLMHVHNLCYVLIGVVLLIYPAQVSSLHTGLLGGLLLGAGISTATLGVRRRRLKLPDNSWFTLSGVRDIIFGGLLLTALDQPLHTMVNLLGAWALVYAFLQSIEAMFYFLGTRSRATGGYWVEAIHFVSVLLAGGFAFMLVMRPDGLRTSLDFVGLFLIGLGIAQMLLTRRLQAGETRLDATRSV